MHCNNSGITAQDNKPESSVIQLPMQFTEEYRNEGKKLCLMGNTWKENGDVPRETSERKNRKSRLFHMKHFNKKRVESEI